MQQLAHRQAAFVREYVLSGNATQAAIKAGYSEKSARVSGPRLLSYDAIKAAIKAELDQVSQQSSVTKTWLVQQLAKEFRAAVGTNSMAAARLGELLARLHGYIVEHKQVRVITSLRDLSDEELKAISNEQPVTIDHEPLGVETGVDKPLAT